MPFFLSMGWLYQVNYMAAEMMSGDLPVTSDADAMAKEKAREAALAAGGTMLTGGTNKRKAGEVSVCVL